VSAVILIVPIFPIAWVAGEIISFVRAPVAHGGIAYAIVAVLGAAAILLCGASAAAAWSLVRRTPMRQPAWAVTATVVGLALLGMLVLFHAGLLIFLLGE
jgi:hypothetical protein